MQESSKIFSGTATRYLSENIAAASGERLGEVAVARFSDGEFQPSFEETVRGELVFIIQSTFAPSDNLFELLMMVDAAKRGLGITQLPDYYLQDALSSGQLVVLLPELQPRDDGIWALYPLNPHLPQKVRLLLDFLQLAGKIHGNSG